MIRNLDFNFENSPTRITANRNCPEIKLAGMTLGPFEEGNEYEVYRWAASELEKAGIAQIREDFLDASKLNKIQWTERIQTAGQISKLPEDFYPRLRRWLVQLKEEVTKNPEKMREYDRVKHLTHDVTNSRLRKIVAIASAPSQTENAFRNFTFEERYLYEQLHKLISEWRTQILECGRRSE